MTVRRKWRQRAAPELDITAFLNLMVVLIPFLLLSAAFNQLSILELSLPKTATEAAPPAPKDKPELELILAVDGLVLNDRLRGPLQRFPNLENGGRDFRAMQLALANIKLSFPDMLQLTVLAQPDTPYEAIIQAMDYSRSIWVDGQGRRTLKELFPQVSLGDAPQTMGASQ
ncbi:ExbD/TolR family protein [Shewanella sedimentimangrovi]|uniref:Biopolymer transporter ExbD n=1 Tax=Shewanella sedimentimangrovi TaxID=2814293 RepID=A0ABX7R3R8_9GAMM|nr:biopolymer transporter ExbD [Shewanella sedimentimangrovi]QSX38134.1 biopolymer transporter ExbD [Shewanella sedimentimangrovi]